MTTESALRQVIPQELCLGCDVCCRFPEADSFLAPYFTDEEISAGGAFGLSVRWFRRPEGSKIRLVPLDPEGKAEGCRCPNFDAITHRCSVYPVRPLDCRLYPFALYWDESGTTVLLGMDTKCPFIREEVHTETLATYAEEVRRIIESEGVLRTLAAHPGLIGPYQDDVLKVATLPKVTEQLRPHAAENPQSADDGGPGPL